jgi:hypothetical protein
VLASVVIVGNCIVIWNLWGNLAIFGRQSSVWRRQVTQYHTASVSRMERYRRGALVGWLRRVNISLSWAKKLLHPLLTFHHQQR